jgi:hypothetical protein
MSKRFPVLSNAIPSIYQGDTTPNASANNVSNFIHGNPHKAFMQLSLTPLASKLTHSKFKRA